MYIYLYILIHPRLIDSVTHDSFTHVSFTHDALIHAHMTGNVAAAARAQSFTCDMSH